MGRLAEAIALDFAQALACPGVGLAAAMSWNCSHLTSHGGSLRAEIDSRRSGAIGNGRPGKFQTRVDGSGPGSILLRRKVGTGPCLLRQTRDIGGGQIQVAINVSVTGPSAA